MRSAAIAMGFLFFWGLTILGGSAQDKAKPETAEQSSTPTVAPSEEFRLGGLIIAIDPARRKILIQQYSAKEERIISLDLGKEAMDKISAFRKGDAVNIWVNANRVIKIEKIPDPDWKENGKEGK